MATAMEYHLGRDVYLVAKDFRGELMVHIHVFEKKADGSKFPTKKGISMLPSCYANLVNGLDLIQRTYEYVNSPLAKDGENRTVHIDGSLYASVTAGYKCVNLRKYFYKETETEGIQFVATRFGVALTIPMWQELLKAGPELKALHPVLMMAVGSYDGPRDEGYFSCYPFPQSFDPVSFYSPITPSATEPTTTPKSLSTASTLELDPAVELEVVPTSAETTCTTTTAPVVTTLGKVMAQKRQAANDLRLLICENTCSF